MGKSLVSSSSRSLPGSELECWPGDPLPSSPLLSSLAANVGGQKRIAGTQTEYFEECLPVNLNYHFFAGSIL